MSILRLSREEKSIKPLIHTIIISIGYLLASETSVQAEAKHAQPADAFVESVGVATHMTWAGSIYATKYNDVKSAMRDLGVRYFRSDGGPTAARIAEDLYRSGGMRGVFVVDKFNGAEKTSGLKPGSAAEVIRSLASNGGAGVYAVEGPNEYDHSHRPNWAKELRDYQAEIFRAVNATPALKNIVIGGPSLVTNATSPASSNALGSVRNSADVGVHHDYVSGGRAPETNYRGAVGMLDRNNYVPGRPYLVTETGVCTNTRQNDGMCISERAQAIYILRTFLDKFEHHHLTKSFYYEFVDQGTTQGNAAWNWGIVRKDMTRKPAFHALKNLITLLSDRGNHAFTTSFLDYNLAGRDAATREVLVQKRNGTYYLMVWRAERSFNTAGDHDITVPAKNMTLTFVRPANVKFYRPTPLNGAEPASGTRAFRTLNNVRSAPIEVADDVIVVEISNGTVVGGSSSGGTSSSGSGSSSGGGSGATTAYIEAGGSASVSETGKTWLSDRFYVGGKVVDRGNIAIANSAVDRLYQTERYGMTAYNIPLAAGNYRVVLHFAETYNGITAAGQRRFGVNVEGTQINNLDVFQAAGGKNKSYQRVVSPVVIDDGALNINFSGPNVPFINAIEVSPN